MKRITSIFALVAILLSTLSLCCFSVSAAESGTWGSLSWTIDDNGILTISGNGAIDDFPQFSSEAWRGHGFKIDSVIVEDGVTGIGDYAFAEIMTLKTVSIGKDVATIGDYVFSETYNVESIKVSKDNPNFCDIDGVLFNGDKTTLIKYPVGNTNTSYSIPQGVTEIIPQAFMGCLSLNRVTIPEGVTSIESGTFANCFYITDISIPASVTFIGRSAFHLCTGIKRVYYNGTRGQWRDITVEDYNEYLITSKILTDIDSIASGSGDINSDGKIDNLDASVVLKYDAGIVELSDAESAVADINNDGIINNLDATTILKYDAGLIN